MNSLQGEGEDRDLPKKKVPEGLLVDNQMNGLESCIGEGNVGNELWLSEEYFCIYSLNKLLNPLLSRRQSNSGKADVLPGGENDACVSRPPVSAQLMCLQHSPCV